MAALRIAIVGLGMAVAPHARSLLELSDRFSVTHAFSRSEPRRAAFAARYGFPVTENIDEIFSASDVDAVLLLTPPNTHLELVQRAAAAGKHVLLEKPLDITLARAEALVASAEQANVILGVVLQNRFRPGAEALQGLVSDGRLGRIVSASARIATWRPQSYYDEPGRGTLARDGGGVLLTQAIHTLDLLVALAGLPARVTAYATTSPVHSIETEDLVSAALQFRNGALGTISATTCAYPGFPEQIEIVGELGTALLSGPALAVDFQDGTSLHTGQDALGGGTGADPMAFSHQAHRGLLIDFADAILAGRPPRISGREALNVHYLIEVLLASSAENAGRPQK